MSQVDQFGPASPFFIVNDLKLSVSFYVDRLGFDLRFQAPDDEPYFVIVGRENAQFMLKFIDKDVNSSPNPKLHPWARWDAFIYISNPDQIANEFTKREVIFKQELSDTDDGLRGFEIEDPNGYVIFFGRPN